MSRTFLQLKSTEIPDYYLSMSIGTPEWQHPICVAMLQAEAHNDVRTRWVVIYLYLHTYRKYPCVPTNEMVSVLGSTCMSA